MTIPLKDYELSEFTPNPNNRQTSHIPPPNQFNHSLLLDRPTDSKVSDIHNYAPTRPIEDKVSCTKLEAQTNIIDPGKAEVTSLAIPHVPNTGIGKAKVTNIYLNAPNPVSEIVEFYLNETTKKIHFKKRNPAERSQVIDRPATDQDKYRYPIQWAKFEAGEDQLRIGTSLDHIYPNQPVKVRNLNSIGIYNVEQGAILSEEGIDELRKIDLGRDFVRACQQFQENKTNSDLKDTIIEDQKKQIEILKRQVERFCQMTGTEA